MARYAGVVDLTVLQAPVQVAPTDFRRSAELIEAGLHAARAELRRRHAPRLLRRAA